MQDFKEGMITRIFVEDFLTYNSVECYPSAKLNMIVGPNGTGKSSIVNAIVLGLGGKTAVIGRAKQLAAFVKRGCKKAKIEIELYHEPNNYIIGRTFDTENKNSWSVNQRPATFKQVEDIIKQMNIQVDNLCQFLPQDRVQDFAKMDSKQLLDNTLKTVGSTEIVEMHARLKELREQETNFGSHTNTVKQQLESEKRKIASLEEEVKAVRERNEMLKSLKNVEKKKGWVEFDIKEVKKKQVLADQKKVLELKSIAEKTIAPFEREIKRTKEEIKLVNDNIKEQIKQNGETASKIKRQFNAVTTVEDQIQSLTAALNRKLDEQKRKAQRISLVEGEIQIQEQHVDSNKENDLNKKIAELQPRMEKERGNKMQCEGNIREIEEQIFELVRQQNRLNATIEREQSAANQKLQHLRHRFPHTFKAYEWLQQNRHRFQGQIYGPIMLELNCAPEVAKYVEFLVPTRELIMFVCEQTDDVNALLRTVRDEMKLMINVAEATQNYHRPVRDNYAAPLPLNSIKQYGFWCYLLDKVEGKNCILNYLCHNLKMHAIPVGNSQTNNMGDKIPRAISYYFSDTKNYFVRMSKYSGEKSSRIIPVKESELLASSTNTALISQCQTKLQEVTGQLNRHQTELTSTKQQLASMEKEINSLQSQKKALSHDLQLLRTGRAKLKMLKDELQVLISSNDVDPEAEKSATNKKTKKLVTDICADQKTIVSKLKQYQEFSSKIQLSKLKKSKLDEILRRKERECMEASRQLDDLKRMLTNVEEELRQAQRDVKRAQEAAMKLTEGLAPKDEAFKKKYARVFAELPNDVDALDAEITNLTARTDCLAGGRAQILEEYEKTKRNIEQLEQTFGTADQRLQNLEQQMETIRNEWIPQVNALIERINKNFTKFFQLMGCVGEVSLEAPEDENEYSKYGICIKVQFRESSRLQQLDTHTQSGGERAVSTAIYMLSLQELTTVPFRCVDEINQGMDEFNERLVFKLMVKTVAKSNSAQCFLLTPKILKKLEYSKHVKVLCIYSGQENISHIEFNVNQYLNTTKQSSQSFSSQKRPRELSDSE